MDSNEQGEKKKKKGPKSDLSLLLQTPEDSGCVFGDLILSEPLYFETELEGELKAAEVHVDSCIQAQLAPAPAAPGSGKMLFPKSYGRAQAGWRSETRKDAGNSQGNTLPSSLR